MDYENYPVSDYYKPYIIDAQTINENEKWWTAVVKIKRPKTKKPIVIVYLWQKRNDEWKVSSKFKFKDNKNSREMLVTLIEMLASEEIKEGDLNSMAKYRSRKLGRIRASGYPANGPISINRWPAL